MHTCLNLIIIYSNYQIMLNRFDENYGKIVENQKKANVKPWVTCPSSMWVTVQVFRWFLPQDLVYPGDDQFIIIKTYVKLTIKIYSVCQNMLNNFKEKYQFMEH